ncbi:MAG: hypothetical protein CFE39_03685 [Comamonadaceae bacterium PBBC2]|nr:MAG: hypothetical protein CFE39_03685 [Comamonadaceae bacterium PBBC2]
MTSTSFHVSGTTQAALQSPAFDLRLMVPTKPAHAIAVHRHDEAHLILVSRGHYQTSARHHGPLQADAPLLVLNPPRTEHQDCFHERQTLADARFFSLTLSADTWMRLQSCMDLPALALATSGPAVQQLAHAWAGACQAPQTPVWDLEAAFIDAVTPLVPCSVGTRALTRTWVAGLRAQLRAHVMEGGAPLQWTAMAQRLGVHPVYMTRAFRQHTGMSPTAFVRRVQLDKAAALLGHTRKPLVDVALECLYFDQAHLAHAFKAAYGLTPAAYRRRKRL